MVCVMEVCLCRAGRRGSKGGDWKRVLSTGMLTLRRNACLFTCTVREREREGEEGERVKGPQQDRWREMEMRRKGGRKWGEKRVRYRPMGVVER